MSREESRPCACGGFITVLPPATDERIRLAVERHQSTPQHLRWRIEEGADDDLTKPLDAYESRLLRKEPHTLRDDDSSGGQPG